MNRGGRERRQGGECVAATADSKLEAREEVLGNIFTVTEKVREEGNSCGAEMSV